MREVRTGNYILVVPDDEKEIKELATQKQINFIHVLVRELNWSREEYINYLERNFSVKSSKNLSKKSASRMIDYLLSLKVKQEKNEVIFEELPQSLEDIGTEI
jgi:hypothetical protein